MQIMISCAKTMTGTSKIEVPQVTTPEFIKEASEIAFYMSQFTVEELERQLKVNSKIAVDNYKRYQEFHSDATSGIPAILAYTGMVYKKLNPQDFTDEDFFYAQQHLRITSFCYGLLRPLDSIRLYRLEGDVHIPELGNKSIFSFWRERLTDCFIKNIKANGKILCNLASHEMKGLFNWDKMEKSIKIITPEFQVWKNGKPTTIVVYAKMCRGEMTRYIIKNRITDPEELKKFTWEGFEYNEILSHGSKLVFTNGSI